MLPIYIFYNIIVVKEVREIMIKSKARLVIIILIVISIILYGCKNVTENDNTDYIEPAFNITFDAQGGESVDDVISVMYNDKLPQLPVPSRIGYDFFGWSDAICEGRIYESGQIWNKKAEGVLYAKWVLKEYFIHYVYPQLATKYTIEDEVTLYPVHLQMGTFMGWYTNIAYTGEPVTKVPKGSTGNKKFYACIRYTITFLDNNERYSETHYIPGKECQLHVPDEKKGFIFKGWVVNYQRTDHFYPYNPQGENIFTINTSEDISFKTIWVEE